MKDVKISIHSTDIRGVRYENQFAQKPGEQIKIQSKTGYAIRLNPASPTLAVVFSKFEATSEDHKLLFEVETATPVVSSTYVDTFEDIIKNNYILAINLAVGERVRQCAQVVGLNITPPTVNFTYELEKKSEGGIDSITIKGLN